MQRRIITIVLALLFAATALVGASVPDIAAEGACLMEAGSQKVLYGKNESQIMYPASTTKIITLLVALEHGKLSDAVTVSQQAADCDGSSMDLLQGDRLTLEDLLYGLILVSGNDAAEAIAEHVGGDRQVFIEWMNEKASHLGAVDTHFSNPHGLPDKFHHYTTAYDMALITAHGFTNSTFVQFVNARQEQVVLTNGRKVWLETHNDILKLYPGANGVKTGFTNDAGLCVVASAKRNGVQLIAVVLNSDDRWQDARKLFDYGFEVMKK